MKKNNDIVFAVIFFVSIMGMIGSLILHAWDWAWIAFFILCFNAIAQLSTKTDEEGTKSTAPIRPSSN